MATAAVLAALALAAQAASVILAALVAQAAQAVLVASDVLRVSFQFSVKVVLVQLAETISV